MTVGGTQAEYVVDIWSGNHPFFQGVKTAVMTNAGRVSRFGDRFSVVNQISGAEFGFGTAIEISPPTHLRFPMVEGQQLSEKLVDLPAQAQRSGRIVISKWVRNLIKELFAKQLQRLRFP